MDSKCACWEQKSCQREHNGLCDCALPQFEWNLNSVLGFKALMVIMSSQLWSEGSLIQLWKNAIKVTLITMVACYEIETEQVNYPGALG